MIYESLDTSGYEAIQKQYHVSDLAAKVLASKKLTSKQIQEILFTGSDALTLPLKELNPIIERIKQAKQKQEKIMICGDYDCDGICATTILYDALTRYGCLCGYYIPNRFNEGYGVQLATIKQAIDKDYRVLITVDNGVKATSELTYAKEHGVCVILSDHHAYEESELVYDYFLHPSLLPPFYHRLCGAGLAYLLSCSLLIEVDPYHTVLAAIATIGDMVGVLDANRVIIKAGLNLLNHIHFLPIDSLSDTNVTWDTTKVAFQIVPKINTLGRLANLANVNTMVRYLLMRDAISIQRVAAQIKELNQQRKQISSENEKLALSLVDDTQDFIVVCDEQFHEGLNGVVAARLLQKYQRPVMVLSKHENILKGSIRSMGIDLTSFFNEIKDKLLSYGGHTHAAGIALEANNLQALILYAQQRCKKDYKEENQVYIQLSNHDISIATIESLSQLEPFGVDFEKPKFLISDSDLLITTLQQGKHLKLKGETMEYLYFNHGYLKDIFIHKSLQFIGDISINNFRNKKSVNMIIDDVIE